MPLERRRNEVSGLPGSNLELLAEISFYPLGISELLFGKANCANGESIGVSEWQTHCGWLLTFRVETATDYTENNGCGSLE